MEERLIRKLLDRERDRWLLWKHDDWREMIEATPDDEDGELFFYSAESRSGGVGSETEVFPVEVVCWPTAEGEMEISLVITIEENEREAEAAWLVAPDGGIEMLADTTDNRELEEEGEDE